MLSHALNAVQPDACIDGNNPVPPLPDILQFVGSTAAPLVIVPLEDMLGLEEQPNLPGTIDTHPNWRRRLPACVESMLDSDAVAGRLAVLAKARARKDRTQ
jgi:4-alpha-glucanotransferase